MAVTFETLKPEARIFLELNNNPHWWKQFKEDTSLYIEVRKDNQVNVYFEGGSIARYTTVANIRNCKSLRIINTWGFLLLQKVACILSVVISLILV